MMFAEMIDRQISALRQRETDFWVAARAFLDQRDAHGIQDIGVEIQGVQHSVRELEALKGVL